MAEQHQFESLLMQLMSADNAVRGQAEKVLNQSRQSQPNEVAQALLQVGRTSTNIELRSFALIVLRRSLLSVDPLWENLNPHTQALIKRELLTGMEREVERQVLSSLRDLTSDLAAEILEDAADGWNELLDWIIQISQSPSSSHKQSVLSVLSVVTVYVGDLFKDKFSLLKGILQSGLVDPDVQVKLSAMNTLVSFVQVFNHPSSRKELQVLILPMLDVLAFTLNNKDEESAQTAIKHFIDLGELDSGFLKPAAPVVSDAMLKIAQVTDLEDSTRQLALEFLVTFVENKPTTCKNISGFIQTLVNVLIQLMLDIDDVSLSEWNVTEENDEASDVANSIVAQENLDRICLVLKGEHIVPIIFEHLPKLVANKDDWKCRHVGLMALSMIGEGCREFLKPHIDKIVSMVLSLFADEHPRVRWAAANTAGQMSTDFGPKFQKQFHQDVLPRLIRLLDDTANPKVQSHSAAATINFCEKFESSMLTPYLPDLLSKLMNLLRSGTRLVQEQAVTAVASVAGCAAKNFIPYYDTFVPLLKEILVKFQSKEYRMLRGKTIECLSLIGVAVGKEKFKPDSGPIMDLLAQIQNSNLDSDDPQREFMLQAWTRISSCLGDEFLPYLKFVMPPLIKSAAMNAGVHVLDGDAEDPGADEEEGWDYVNVGDTKIAIHTAALEEKASACNMIYSYAAEMKEGFFPFVEEVSKLTIPLMTFYYHDGVRLAALSVAPLLLQSTKLFCEKNNQDRKLLNDLFGYVYPHLLEAVNTENDQEVLVVGIEALHEALNQMGPNTLSPEQVKELLQQVKTLIVAMQKRRAEVTSRIPDDGDADESVIIREELVKEDDISNEIAEVIGAIVKNQPQFFLANFQDIFPLVMDMLQKNKPASERQLALCVFDDIVEHTQNQSLPLFQHFLPFMMEYSLDPHPGVRQASCFGLGVCAQFGGETFKPAVRRTLELLVQVITQPESRVDRNAPPTENAISSVAKIILYQTAEVQEKLAEIINMWVSWLPVTVDYIEAKVVHQQLLTLIKNNNTLVFGSDFRNLPKVLSIFSEIVQVNPEDPLLITLNTHNEILQLLTQMQQQFPGQLLQQAFAAIPAENQQRLQRIMSGSVAPPSQ